MGCNSSIYLLGNFVPFSFTVKVTTLTKHFCFQRLHFKNHHTTHPPRLHPLFDMNYSCLKTTVIFFFFFFGQSESILAILKRKDICN